MILFIFGLLVGAFWGFLIAFFLFEPTRQPRYELPAQARKSAKILREKSWANFDL